MTEEEALIGELARLQANINSAYDIRKQRRI